MAIFVFSLYGFLLSPKWIQTLLQLSEEELYWANVVVGWLSPLNHAAYHMHNFGYDLLPRRWQSYLLFGLLIALCQVLTILTVRQYPFNFSGEEDGT